VSLIPERHFLGGCDRDFSCSDVLRRSILNFPVDVDQSEPPSEHLPENLEGTWVKRHSDSVRYSLPHLYLRKPQAVLDLTCGRREWLDGMSSYFQARPNEMCIQPASPGVSHNY
jgi:hypothetical protein